MWQDVENDTDFLNFGELADLVVDLLQRPNMLPLSLGVFGGWGSGKSTLLRIIEGQLTARGPDSHFLIVKFDAWLFQGYDDARAALLEEIARHLAEAAKKDEALSKKAGNLLKRVNFLRILGTAADVGASIALGIPTFGALGRGLEGATNFMTGSTQQADLDAMAAAAGDATKEGSLLKEAKPSTPPTEIRAFRKEFREVLEGLQRTLVVFVDNLDRCLPEATIETLEAIRLFLFLPKTAFVIAADEAVIRHAVSKHFEGLNECHVRDYLDKLIQIPIRAPNLGIREVRAYMFLLFLNLQALEGPVFEEARELLMQNLRSGWQEAPITTAALLAKLPASKEIRKQLDLAERLAPVLATAPNILGNPRIVKRLLNTLLMRFGLAKRRGITVDEGVLAKLAVLERGTDEDTYAHLIRLVVDDPSGQPELLSKLEKALEDEGWDDLCPPEWKRQESFLKLWFGLEPALGARDLRTAVYLSRENVPLFTPPGQLTYQAVQVLTALKIVDSVTSIAAKKAAESLSPAERSAVLQGLVGEMRKATTWRTRVAGFSGALILVGVTPALQNELSAFLHGLPPADVGPWIMPLLKKSGGDWATDLLMRFREANDGPASRKKPSSGKSE